VTAYHLRRIRVPLLQRNPDLHRLFIDARFVLAGDSNLIFVESRKTFETAS